MNHGNSRMKITYHYNGKKYDSIEALLDVVPSLRIDHATVVRELGNNVYEIDGERIKVDEGTVVYFGHIDRMYSRNGSCYTCSGVLHMGGAPIKMEMNM